MRPFLATLLLLTCSVPAFAAEMIYQRYPGSFSGEVQKDGDFEFTLIVTYGTNSFPWKCLAASNQWGLVSWQDQDGEDHQTVSQLVYDGAEAKLVVWRTSPYLNGTGAIFQFRHITGVVTSPAANAYEITDEDDSKVYRVVRPAAFPDKAKLDAAVTSGDTVTLGGTIAYRGTGGALQTFLVIEDYVE